jgi:hypothetical protein
VKHQPLRVRGILGCHLEGHACSLFGDREGSFYLTNGGLRVGTSTATERFWTENNRTRYDVLSGEGGLHLEERPELEVP